MEYAKLFETSSEYQAYIANIPWAKLPNVSYCVENNDVYAENLPSLVVAKYNVTSTTNPTKIGYYSTISGFSQIEIDGTLQPSVVSSYTFDSLGEHTVRYKLADPKSIGNNTFNGCSGLTSITIPSGITNIGDYVFYGCSGLTSASFAKNSQLNSIGGYAFSACTNLTSISIPSGVTSIGEYAFADCSGLTSITFAEDSKLGVIYAAIFKSCRSLTSITIPSGVTSIGTYAFSYCTGLTSIIVPSGVTKIGYEAFKYCTSLNSVTCLPTTPPTLGSDAFKSNASGRKIYVPSGSLSAYKVATNWKTYASDIEAITT